MDPTTARVAGDRLVVSERAAGRLSAIDRDGNVSPLVEGLSKAASVDLLDGGYAVGAGAAVLLIDANGNERRIDGFDDAQGVAVVGTTVFVADAGRHELVAIDVAAGSRDVVVAGAPIGQPVPGVVPAAFSALTADGAGAVLVGCNGDGSIRRLVRA